MKWAKRAPAIPGWYWCRNTCDEEGMVPALYKVFEFDGKLFYALEGGSFFIKPHDTLEWYGPITPPE